MPAIKLIVISRKTKERRLRRKWKRNIPRGEAKRAGGCWQSAVGRFFSACGEIV